MTGHPKKRRPRRALRGKRLIDAALREVADFFSWTAGTPLTQESLAARLGVSRQAIATKPVIVDAIRKTKAELRMGGGEQAPDKVVRRTLEQRLEQLQKEKAQMQAQLDAWIEKWVTVE